MSQIVLYFFHKCSTRVLSLYIGVVLALSIKYFIFIFNSRIAFTYLVLPFFVDVILNFLFAAKPGSQNATTILALQWRLSLFDDANCVRKKAFYSLFHFQFSVIILSLNYGGEVSVRNKTRCKLYSPSNKPLSALMAISLRTHICVTRPH